MSSILNVLILAVILGLLLCGTPENTDEEQVSLKEYGIALIGFTIFVFIFMYRTGVLNSGYHFQDDHEIYTIEASLRKTGLISTMIARVREDFLIRFRFTYYIIRTLQVWLMGSNFKLWHIMQSASVVLSMFCSYIFARKMQVSRWLSCVLIVVAFIGEQSEVLWRLGPQENIGMLLLMLTFLSLLYYLKNEKFLIVCIILTFFLGGAKESFLLILPALPIWLMIVECRNQENGQINFKRCWEIAKRRWVYFISVFLIFSVDMVIILWKVGLNKIGYAGIDNTFGLKDYLHEILWICRAESNFGFYTSINLIGALGIVIFFVYQRKNFKKELFANVVVSILMFVYGLGSQLVLHAKSGMHTRYLLPATAFFAIFWIVDIGNFLKKTERGKIFIYVFCAFVVMGCIMKYNVINKACQYAQDGKATTALLDKVAEYGHSDPTILAAFQSIEFDYSTTVYLREKYGINNVYGLSNAPEDEGGMAKYIRNPRMDQPADNGEVQIYVGYASGANDVGNLIQEYGIALEKYNSYIYGDYAMYVDKKIDISY